MREKWRLWSTDTEKLGKIVRTGGDLCDAELV